MAIFNVTIGSYANLSPSQIGDITINLNFNETHTFGIADFTTGTIPIYVDPEGDEVETVRIETLPTLGSLELSAVAVVALDEITLADIVAGNLTYEAAIGETAGYTDNDMTFDIADDGSSTYSGLTPGIVTFIAAFQENQPPSEVGDGSASTDYGVTLVFTEAMFSTGTTPVYADPENDLAYQLKITTLPILGEIQYNGTAVNINDIILFSDIALGLLTYIPDNADTDGDVQAFTFEVADAGSGTFVA